MDGKQTPAGGHFWWLKNPTVASGVSKQSERDISSSLAEYLVHEQEVEEFDDDVDIPSILEEISRLSANSPMGQYQKDIGELSIDEIMKEAEKIYKESSKSFEQLSQGSKASHLSDQTDNATPTPKSLSPLPLDTKAGDDCNSESDTESVKAPNIDITPKEGSKDTMPIDENYSYSFDSPSKVESPNISEKLNDAMKLSPVTSPTSIKSGLGISTLTESDIGKAKTIKHVTVVNSQQEELEKKENIIKMLLSDNKGLREEMQSILHELNELKQHKRPTGAANELSNALEMLKDTQEQKTALHVQLEAANKSHAELRSTCDELMAANNILERRVMDLDSVLTKYKSDLKAIQSIRDKLKENEFNANKLLEQERAQAKQFKQQVEKDAKCILDLNRQIKEMERIIARKHPDSVSALIVASKYDDHGARKMFEERIKSLEQEALLRDAQNSKVFMDVQEKFNQMKLKYESHIEDLELHVNDLKSQLKRNEDTYDVYTQTVQYIDEKIPAKDTTNRGCQTDAPNNEKVAKSTKKPEAREDAHLLATIRGYQSELATKEKAIVKAQKDNDELRRTNRRLQKEREGSLRTNFNERKMDKGTATAFPDDELSMIRNERDTMKTQLLRVEADFQALKAKRLQDLNTLQEAHEREMANYLENVTPLREKLEVQTVSLSALKQQLMTAKEELAVITVERDVLNNKLNSGVTSLLQDCNFDNGNENEAMSLRRKLNVLEMKYEERENRLRKIVHGLAQKTIVNRTCEQCAERQQQLVGYKIELDQIIATLRCLQ